jgi:tagatose 1,6-diphosphate aldolase GatY/KbaY
MPLVTTKKMLEDARRNGYAVGAFNVENLEMVMAVVAAAEELRAPVILQTTPSTVRYSSLDYLKAMVKVAARRAGVPVAIHLDHGESFDMAMAALRAGYTSVMIDGSHSVFEENVALTLRVAQAARAMGVPVEAELGKVGGKEDDTDGGDGGYTVPAEAAEFAVRTGVDSLAVAIGTAHGVYKGVPRLDVDRLSQIAALVDIPLVLHGASGVPDDAVRDCISRGVAKVNFATELRIAYSNGVKAVLAKDPQVFDPKKYGKAGMDEVTRAVKEKISICSSAGKAQ